MNVLALVRKEFNVDDQRIYLMGHSMGARHLAHRHQVSRCLAAIAPISPAIFRPRPKSQDQAHPVILIQATKQARPVARLGQQMKENDMVYEYIKSPAAGTWTWRSRTCLRFSSFSRSTESRAQSWQ